MSNGEFAAARASSFEAADPSPLPSVNTIDSVPHTPIYESPLHSATGEMDNSGSEQQEQIEEGNLPVPMVRFLQSDPDGADQDFGSEDKANENRGRRHYTRFQDIIEVVKEGRAKDLEELLGPPQPQSYAAAKGKRIVQIDKQDAEGYTMLHYAARNNHTNVCDVLVRRGADINALGPDFMTPLHLAAKYRRSRTKAAQAAAAAADHLDTDSEDPMRKSLIDKTDAVFFLLSNRADFTLKDFYGCTPLHYAAMKGNVVASRCLLHFEMRRQKNRMTRQDAYSSQVAIWRITDNEDMTPLHLACAHKEVLIVKMLIEVETNDRDYLDMEENTGCTALHLASAEGDADICSFLLHAAEQVGEGFLKRYINKKDLENNTSLHSAVENECVEVAEMLLNRGAFVNACNTSRETPLHLSARTGNTELIELLIQHGACLDALDCYKQNALHKAAYFNQNELLSYLLEKDSSVIDVTDREENTPLLLASCQQDDPQCVKILLDNGANPLCSDGQDRTALYLAAQWQNVNVLRALLENRIVKENRVIDEADVNNNTPLHVACDKGFLDVVDLLLQNDAKFDDKNEDEETPMHLAAKGGHAQIVRHLLRLSRNLANDEDEDSNTPLHLASLAGQAKICQVLIEEGKADVEARNSRGWTALDCAASKGFTKVAQVLLDNDSPIDPADKSNVTPLFLACQSGHLEMVDLLLRIGASVSNRIKYSDTKSPLHNCNCLDAAIDSGHKKVALTLINSPQWKEALRNETIGEKGEKDTPLRKLIRKMPTVAEKVFNKCVENNKQRKSPDDPDYKVVFYYEFLDDMYSSWGPIKLKDSDEQSSSRGAGSDSNASDSASVADFTAVSDVYDGDGRLRGDIKFRKDKGSLKKNHPLMVMVRKKREDLLLHPLVAALLRHKWISYGRWVYYINLGLYAVFLAAFTAYMLDTKATYMYYGPYYSNNVTGWTSNECEQVRAANPSCSQRIVAAITKWIVIVLGALFLLKEISQMFMNKLRYLNMENLMDWSIFSLAIVAAIDISSCQQICGVRTYWQWNCGIFAMLLSWLNLVLFLRKMPRFGIFVVMFTDVLRTFLQFFVVFFLFILAFGLTFHLLFQNQLAYDTVAKSLLKTSVMMIGEFEYDAVFTSQYDTSNTAAKDQVFYDASAYIVFVLFLVVMSIIIMNLLVGLAVDDIKSVMDQASLKRLAMQVELALEVEAFLPFTLTRKFVIKSEAYFPNPIHKDQLFSIRNFFQNRWLSRDELEMSLNPELDEWEKIYKKQDENALNLISVRNKVKDMRSRISNIEGLLNAIARKLDISEAGSLGGDDGEDGGQDYLLEM